MIRLYEDLNIKFYTLEIVGISLLLLATTVLYGKTGEIIYLVLLLGITILYVIGVSLFFTKKAKKRLEKSIQRKDKEELERIKKKNNKLYNRVKEEVKWK